MLTIRQTHNPIEALLALPFLASIDQYYPDIKEWFINTVVPGVCTGNDILLIASEYDQIAGILLAKTGEENKLRCIRVAEKYKNRGLGIKLMDRSLEMIGDKPLVTVSEELLHQYARIFVRRYGFSLDDVVKGQYRPQKLEYFFNHTK